MEQNFVTVETSQIMLCALKIKNALESTNLGQQRREN